MYFLTTSFNICVQQVYAIYIALAKTCFYKKHTRINVMQNLCIFSANPLELLRKIKESNLEVII